jgi:hypothetical protein
MPWLRASTAACRTARHPGGGSIPGLYYYLRIIIAMTGAAAESSELRVQSRERPGKIAR